MEDTSLCIYLSEEQLAEFRKRENPYVVDLIAVLAPHKNGVHRHDVFRSLKDMRIKKGLSIPEAFE